MSDSDQVTDEIRAGLEIAADGADSDRDRGRMLALRSLLDAATVAELLSWLERGAEAYAHLAEGGEDDEGAARMSLAIRALSAAKLELAR